MSNSSALSSSCCALILAAGKGNPMHSKKPKGVHTIWGEPVCGSGAGGMVSRSAEAVRAAVCPEGEIGRAAFRGRELGRVGQKCEVVSGES